jgi:hypothetical protein
MPISKCRPRSRAVGVLVAFAVCGWLAGCAGPGERLPQCKGRPVPINPPVPAAAAAAHVSEADAH